ncbi:uncharacterized protein LOC105208923 [Zeugodacus cucurbitae]|uniref:uncharacterized protein LOC105208923 n=1 Tax=Zeugodacus cucurbitae TaxID=28588 RepID=UPI0005969727|nr:uncharacterized protein LOC105208923 [Zeugodacus cucurbitae]
MNTKYVTFCRWLAVLVLLQTFMPPGAESKPMPGKKTKMALSAIAGLTAGHLIGRATANRPKKEKFDMSEHLPPNCRKEVSTKCDPQDSKKFITIEQIICDPLPNQQPQQQQIQFVQPSLVVPVQPVAPSIQQVQPAVVQQPPPAGFQQPAQPIGFVQPPQQAVQQPSAPAPQTVQVVQPLQQVQSQQPVQPVQSVQIPQTVQTNQAPQYIQTVQQPLQPVQVVQQPQPAQPAPGTSQVFVLSKKTGYFGKSSTDRILQTNLVLMMMMAFLLIWFQ